MRKSKTDIKINKIEIDDKTAEPTIVEIGLADIDEDTENPEANWHETKTEEEVRSEGKQLVMTKLFGMNEKDAVSQRQKVVKKVLSAVFIIFVVAVLAFTFYQDFFAQADQNSGAHLESFYETFKKCWYYLLFAFIALFSCYVLKGFKLSFLCRVLTHKWHLKTCMETAVIGHYYNYVTPLAVGGQPFEIYHLSKHGVHGGVAASLPIAAFFLNQFAFVLLGAVSLIAYSFNLFGIPHLSFGESTIFTIMATVGLISCLFTPSLVVIFSMLPKIGVKIVAWAINVGGKLRIVKDPKKTAKKTIRSVKHNSKCLKLIASRPLVFITALLISFGEQLSLCSIAYFTLKFFGYNIEGAGDLSEWLQIVQMAFILYAAISFIPTPGNSGAADYSFHMLFEASIFMVGGAFFAMLLWRLLSFYSFIIVGFIFTTAKKKSDKKKEQKQQDATTEG